MDNKVQNTFSKDIKEIQKRGREIILISMLVGLVLAPLDYYKGLVKSALVVVVFSISMIILFFLNEYFGFKKIKVPTFLMVCGVLIMGTFNEGLATGNFFYFFPMLIIIPAILDQKSNKSEFITLFIISGLGAVSCLLIGMNFKALEHISSTTNTELYYTNFVASLAITIAFAYLNIKFEGKYIEAIHEQKNHSIAARNKFLSIMGHELRTPLNGIIGASNVLKEGKTLEEQKDYIDILSYCSDHMLLLVNDILDFNKMEAGKLNINPIPLNLKQMLAKSALPFYNLFEAKNLEFQVSIAEDLDIWVLGDDVRIIQVINNLFSNALKFTGHGKVEFSAKVHHLGDKDIEVYFSVKDSGPGIEEKYQKLIFESFWQIYDESNRNFTGTGLGLAICMRLLELMNSTLKLRSKLGEGSDFYFILPFKKISQDHFPLPDSKKVTCLHGKKILLVEDNEINVLIAKKTLKDVKAEIQTAYNGQEAINLLEYHKEFDLVLLDLEMPVLNGYMAVGPILKLLPGIPVLAFTASLIDSEKMDYLFRLGFSDIILKPYQTQKFLEIILKHIGNSFENEADFTIPVLNKQKEIYS